MNTKYFKTFIASILVLGSSVVASAVWQSPPAPLYAPLNTSSVDQTKSGQFVSDSGIGSDGISIFQNFLSINTVNVSSNPNVKVLVNGPIGADSYCDTSGNNCINPGSTGVNGSGIGGGGYFAKWIGGNTLAAASFMQIVDNPYLEGNTNRYIAFGGDNSGGTTPLGAQMRIYGSIGADAYCDRQGNDCIEPGESMVNAVVAFDSTTCPTGWSKANGTADPVDMRGRTIFGLDSSDADFKPLLENGGAYERLIQKRNLPVIEPEGISNMTISISPTGPYEIKPLERVKNGTYGTKLEVYSGTMNVGGSANPFKIVDPYVTYLYCVRD